MPPTSPMALTASPSASLSISRPDLVLMHSSMAPFHAELTYLLRARARAMVPGLGEGTCSGLGLGLGYLAWARVPGQG